MLTDALGSTVALSDSNGTVQTEYTYEPFGATTATGTASTNSFQYTGREDDETGLYYYRARYYHPSLQRFISEDPIEFAGGDANLYAYVSNNPTNLVDPSGENPWVAACVGGALFDIGITTGLDLLAGRKVTLGGIALAGAKGCAAGLVGYGIGRALGKAFELARTASNGRVAVGDFRLSETVAKHLDDIVSKGRFKGEPARPFLNSPHTIQEIMRSRPSVPDPRGFPGALRWDVPGAFRGSQGAWELVVNPKTSTILHLNFVSGL